MTLDINIIPNGPDKKMSWSDHLSGVWPLTANAMTIFANKATVRARTHTHGTVYSDTGVDFSRTTHPVVDAKAKPTH